LLRRGFSIGSELDDLGLVWRDNGHVLGLAVPDEVARERLESGWPRTWAAIYN